jgi:hypothetical protein
MIRKTSSPKPGHIRVVFELPTHLIADQVLLAADFNRWNPHTTPIRRDDDGVWRMAVDLPAGHSYQFRYIIDGHWTTDEHADGFVPNSYNSLNSLIDTHLPIKSCAPTFAGNIVREAYRPTVPFYVKHPCFGGYRATKLAPDLCENKVIFPAEQSLKLSARSGNKRLCRNTRFSTIFYRRSLFLHQLPIHRGRASGHGTKHNLTGAHCRSRRLVR